MVDTATEISVELDNEPGTLGDAATTLGEAGVNIQGFTIDADGPTGTVRFVTDDPDTAESELETSGFSPTRRELVLAQAPNEPGELGSLASRLGDSGVNIETGFPVFGPTQDTPTIAFAVDDIASARKAIQG